MYIANQCILDTLNMAIFKKYELFCQAHFKFFAVQFPTNAIEIGRMSCILYEQAVSRLIYFHTIK